MIGKLTSLGLVAMLGISAAAPVAVAKSGGKNIVEVAQENGNFGTLIAAAKAAGIVGALTAPGGKTVFAPTDAAFAKLPKGTVESLLKPENKKKLTAILTYHVVGKQILAKDIPAGSTHVKTLNGASLTVTKKGGKVTVNSSNVTTADVKASNGVIHVIDTVLLPK
jgi:uncharacterized surface protein with fasciclin (FAS1) repeats